MGWTAASPAWSAARSAPPAVVISARAVEAGPSVGGKPRRGTERDSIFGKGAAALVIDLAGTAPTLLDSIDLIVPHQAHKTMVIKLAGDAGLTPDRLYFNIDSVGNVPAAGMPPAIVDARAEGVIEEPMRVLAPGFGAGAVGGCAVLRVDPAVIADTTTSTGQSTATRGASSVPDQSEHVHEAFG